MCLPFRRFGLCGRERWTSEYPSRVDSNPDRCDRRHRRVPCDSRLRPTSPGSVRPWLERRRGGHLADATPDRIDVTVPLRAEFACHAPHGGGRGRLRCRLLGRRTRRRPTGAQRDLLGARRRRRRSGTSTRDVRTRSRRTHRRDRVGSETTSPSNSTISLPTSCASVTDGYAIGTERRHVLEAQPRPARRSRRAMSDTSAADDELQLFREYRGHQTTLGPQPPRRAPHGTGGAHRQPLSAREHERRRSSPGGDGRARQGRRPVRSRVRRRSFSSFAGPTIEGEIEASLP